MNLAGKRIMLIGGAGLVGSHIVDQLVSEPVSEIVVYDNFVRGTRENLASALKSPKVRVVEGSMTDRANLQRSGWVSV
jgi:UDP-glucose 4-epimerase